MWRTCVLALLGLTGCNQIFGLSKVEVVDSPTVIGGQCGSGSDVCNAPMVCDTISNECVQCVAGSAATTANCSGTTPVCGSDDTCQACAHHSDCPSDVCNLDGSCAEASQVSYVSSGSGSIDPVGTTDEPCSQAMPCATIAGALLSHELQPTIKVRGSIDKSTVIPAGLTVSIVGDTDAELHADTGPTIGIGSNAVVSLRDLTISGSSTAGIQASAGASGGSVTVIHCQITNNSGVGIFLDNTPSAAAAPPLTLAQSVISKNSNGGLDDTGPFDIVGNVFSGNGRTGSTVGGASVSDTGTTDRLDFNTFAENVNNGMSGAGLVCTGSVTARNDIIAENTGSATVVQVSGSCSYAYTLATSGISSGSNIFTADPQFVNPAGGDLQLEATSPARGSADPSSDLSGLAAVDPNGAKRITPADLGAFAHHN